MPVDPQYLPDVEAILSHRHDHGHDFWTTPDHRIQKGGPFSMLECMQYLCALGMEPDDPLLRQCVELAFSTWRENGGFRVYPKAKPFPCNTTHAAAVLCQLGHASDPRIATTFRHLLDIRYEDGGWRCEKFFFGRGPETEHSNPQPTLMALDAFRYSEYLNVDRSLDRAVEFLLGHWETRAPIGPCHYGIGTLFMQVEYPFRGYNLFYYCYILSHYDRAKDDPRFLEALAALESKLSPDGEIVVERVVPKLAKLRFCQKGRPSPIATGHYREILHNLGR